MLNIKGVSRVFSTLLAMVFVAMVVGVVFKFSSLSGPESPPSLNPGASLFQGKLFSKAVAYYYSDEETNVEELMNCIDGADSAVFIYYSPEEQQREEGFYIYPDDLGEKSVHLIEVPADFIVPANRAFSLFMDGEIQGDCFNSTSKQAEQSVDLKDVKKGWVQIVADSGDLSEALKEMEERLEYVWVQSDDNTFKNVKLEDLGAEELKDFYAVWVKLI